MTKELYSSMPAPTAMSFLLSFISMTYGISSCYAFAILSSKSPAPSRSPPARLSAFPKDNG
jgi:hypothetical protein